MASKRIGFIGAGNMAFAIARGLTRQGLPPSLIRCSDRDPERARWVQEQLGVSAGVGNVAVVSASDVVVVAVKPQVLGDLLQEVAPHFKAGQVVVSVCAGVPMERFRQHLPDGVKLARAMPNTPALVGAGATALALGEGLSEAEQALIRGLFDGVGECVVVSERYLDAVTGLSGSGPAYVMMVIEALADGGVRAGLPRDIAALLARQTVLGAARLVIETGEHPAKLREQVTSPGGTTAEGLFALEQAGVRVAFTDAVCRAARRAAELGTD
jgi:pyrroline-5-carboxylate reductase